MFQKEDLKVDNSYVDHYFKFYHLISDIQQQTCQQAADQIEYPHQI